MAHQGSISHAYFSLVGFHNIYQEMRNYMNKQLSEASLNITATISDSKYIFTKMTAVSSGHLSSRVLYSL